MIAVLMSTSAATLAWPRSTERLCRRTNSASEISCARSGDRQHVGLAHQVLGQRAPEPLVVDDGLGEPAVGGPVGLVDRAEAAGDLGEDGVLGAAGGAGGGGYSIAVAGLGIADSSESLLR